VSDTSVSDTFSELALAGAVAVVVFATVGQINHEGGVSFGGYAADLVPMLASWLVVAAVTRRFLPTWLVGVTLGVVTRMIVVGHYHWNQLQFLAVALVFVGALAWVTRGLLRTSTRRRRARSGRS
jgi:hypothetical protein